MKIVSGGGNKVSSKNIQKVLGTDSRVPKGPVAHRPKRFRLMQDLSQVSKRHSWTSATISMLGRAIVGAGWRFVPVDDDIDESGLNLVKSFFMDGRTGSQNIKDFVTLASKIYQTVTSYRLFGQCGWEIIRLGDRPVGFDVVSGYIEPNVDERGYFVDPDSNAFTVYPWSGKGKEEYSLKDFVYFFDPGITGLVSGETVYEALAETSIPSDMFAAISYRELFENVNAPYNGVWEINENTSDSDFNYFVELLNTRYSGAENFGKNPLVIRGGAKFVPTSSRNSEDAPYLEGRRYNQEEISAVTGVDGNKLGLTKSATKANMRESRREFHENTVRPLVNYLEEVIYRQVIVRILGVDSWKIQFNRPDFMTELERATIDTRDVLSGLYNSNEIRARRGDAPREGGDVYYMPANAVPQDAGMENRRSGTGMLPPERPPRDEGPSTSEEKSTGVSPTLDYSSGNLIKEIRAWRKCHLRFLDGKRETGYFEPNEIPQNVYQMTKELLESADDFGEVKRIFNALEGAVRSVSV